MQVAGVWLRARPKQDRRPLYTIEQHITGRNKQIVQVTDLQLQRTGAATPERGLAVARKILQAMVDAGALITGPDMMALKARALGEVQ